MLRDAIVLRSLHPSVREKCLDEGDSPKHFKRQFMLGRTMSFLKTPIKMIQLGEVNAISRQARGQAAEKESWSQQRLSPG